MSDTNAVITLPEKSVASMATSSTHAAFVFGGSAQIENPIPEIQTPGAACLAANAAAQPTIQAQAPVADASVPRHATGGAETGGRNGHRRGAWYGRSYYGARRSYSADRHAYEYSNGKRWAEALFKSPDPVTSPAVPAASSAAKSSPPRDPIPSRKGAAKPPSTDPPGGSASAKGKQGATPGQSPSVPKPAPALQASVQPGSQPAAPLAAGSTIHGHPGLAASRRSAYEYVQANCWIKALESALQRTDSKVILYDIGGGRMGVESALRFVDKLSPRFAPVFDRVYVHVSLPIVSAADVDRAAAVDRHAQRVSIGVPRPLSDYAGGRSPPISLCDHKFGECTCIPAGVTPAFISVHTLYYLDESEYLTAYNKYGDFSIFCAIHRPEEGGALPRDNPEFIWVGPKSSPELFTWQERFNSRIRKALLDDPLVAMVPLRDAGSIYKHSAMRWLASGGKHVSDISAWIDQSTSNHVSTVTILFWLLALSVFVVALLYRLYQLGDVLYYDLLYQNRWYSWARSGAWFTYIPVLRDVVCWAHYRMYGPSVTVYQALVQILWACVAPVLILIFLRFVVLTSRDPGFLTVATIGLVHRTSLSDQAGDPVVDIFSVVVGPPRPLEPLTFGVMQMAPDAYRHALSILLALRDDEASAARTTSALLRRYQYSVATTLGSVRRAREAAASIRADLASSGPGNVSGSSSPGMDPPASLQRSALRTVRSRLWQTAAAWCVRTMFCAIVASVMFGHEAQPWWESLSRGVGW